MDFGKFVLAFVKLSRIAPVVSLALLSLAAATAPAILARFGVFVDADTARWLRNASVLFAGLVPFSLGFVLGRKR